MGKRRFFDKASSFAEDDVVLSEVPEAEVVAWSDVQETEVFTLREQGVKNEPMDVAVPTSESNEPTPAEIKFAKGFKGTPSPVDHASKQLAQSCASTGLLADFGPDDGYARGFKWHLYCK